MKILSVTLFAASVAWNTQATALTYPIVGTGQTQCYDNFSVVAAPPPSSQPPPGTVCGQNHGPARAPGAAVRHDSAAAVAQPSAAVRASAALQVARSRK